MLHNQFRQVKPGSARANRIRSATATVSNKIATARADSADQCLTGVVRFATGDATLLGVGITTAAEKRVKSTA